MDKNKILLMCVSVLLIISVIFAVLKVNDKKPENNKSLSSSVTSTEISSEQIQISSAVSSAETSAVTSAEKTTKTSVHTTVSAETSASSQKVSSSVTSSAVTSSSSSSKTSSSSSSSSSSGRNNNSSSSGNTNNFSSGGSDNSYSSNGQTKNSSSSEQIIHSTTTVKSDSASQSTVQTETVTTEPYVEIITEEITQPPTQPSVLEGIFAESGENIDNLGDCQQIICVSSYNSYCDVSMYEKFGDEWENVYNTYGIVGLNGVSIKSGEGDYCTPKGLFGLGFGFGTDDLYGLNIEYRKFNENCYWVDDPESDYYNQWVESEDTSAWNSAEHLVDYPIAYHYAVAINYNMEAVKGAGSAIFLHCAVGNYTAGCVGIPEDGMFYVMNWLDSSKDPKILIY